MRSLSKTWSKPALLNSLMATGVVMSLPRTRSSLAEISWPGTTVSSPAWAARIFWVMVIPMVYFPPSMVRLMAENSALMDEAMISSWIPAPQTFLPSGKVMLT